MIPLMRGVERPMNEVTTGPEGPHVTANEPEFMKILAVTTEWEKAPFVRQQIAFLQRLGHQVDVFHFQGRKNPINYLRAWWRLRRQYDPARYDVLHAHFGQSGMVLLPRKRPLVVTFRGSDLQGVIGHRGRVTLPGRVLQSVSRFVASRADRIIVVSEHMAAFLPPGARYDVLPSGLDLSLFKPMDRMACREELGLPADKKLILFGGRPETARKRVPLAQAAVALLKKEVDAELVLMNSVPHERMPMYHNACDVVFLTSVHEGSPNIVKEALACNVPVVSVDVGDVRERIAGIEGCYLVQEDTPEALAAALARALKTGREIAGRHRVRSLSEEQTVERLQAIYDSAITAWERRAIPYAVT